MSTREYAATYGVGTQGGMHPEDQPSITRDHPRMRKVPPGIATPVLLPNGSSRQGDATQRLPLHDEGTGVDTGYDDYCSKAPRSAVRYDQQAPHTTPPQSVIRVTHHRDVPQRAHAMQYVPTHVPRPQPKPMPRLPQPRWEQPTARLPWTGYLGLTLLIMLLGWILLSLFFQWWQGMQDDWHYGRPRIYQTDAVVGGDSAARPTHFMTLNIHGTATVIEMHAGDPNKTSTLVGPTNADPLDPVTLQFKDVNHDGKLDMLLTVHNTCSVFINEGNGNFRPATYGEKISL